MWSVEEQGRITRPHPGDSGETLGFEVRDHDESLRETKRSKGGGY